MTDSLLPRVEMFAIMGLRSQVKATVFDEVVGELPRRCMSR